MSSPSNNKRAHEAQTEDNPRKKVKAGNACGTAEGFEPLVLPSTINHQPSAIDQAPSTSSQNSTISQFEAVGQPTSLNANNSKPATTSNDIQTSQEYIISLPARLVSCQDEMERLIKDSIEDIEKNNEILRGIKRLKDEGKLEEVRSRCYEVLELINSEHLSDYLQKQLNLTFDLKDNDVRKIDVTFYYLLKGEELHKPHNIIHRALYPFTGHSPTDDFYELCCTELWFDEAFAQWYKRLDNNQTALEYLLYKKPALLLNKRSHYLIDQLMNNTQLDLHQIIKNIRDEKGQTYMFYMADYEYYEFQLYKLYFSVYRKNLEGLYELLSIKNCDGQTALHVNTGDITWFLSEIYTRKQREEFTKLTSIKDNSNKTAFEILPAIKDSSAIKDSYSIDDWRDQLSALMKRVENNEYVMNAWDGIPVLIIYNTNNRPGAEEEAQTIYNAFRSITYTSYITFKKNKNKADIIQLIEESANERFVRNNDDAPIKSLTVILTSHGNVGTIEDCDGNPIELSAIEQAMCSDILDGRPKMLITQCCQNTTPEVDEKLKAYAPVNDDFCAVMSSVPGQKSTRGVFLGKLAEEIKNSNKETNIFKLVNNVSREMEREGHSQTPIIMSTLKSEFCPSDKWYLPKN